MSANARRTHERLARGWGQEHDGAELIRKAMVLVADHEITSSAFAARITASTGASLPGCLLTGLATFSGPLHGDASAACGPCLKTFGRLGAEQVVAHHFQSAIPIPGFGTSSLSGWRSAGGRAARSAQSPPQELRPFIDKVVELTGLKPNIDVALATLAAQLALPGDAAFGLFATARSVGLLAHSIEQLRVGKVIRPRGRYTGRPWKTPPPRRPRKAARIRSIQPRSTRIGFSSRLGAEKCVKPDLCRKKKDADTGSRQ